MKRTNSYYHDFFKRPAKLKMTLLNMALALSYTFRIPIEVITRRNLGERYFNILLSSLIGLGLLIFPYLIKTGLEGMPGGIMLTNYITWYAYSGYYLYCVYQRWKEIQSLPSVWDFKRFSLSEGKTIPFLTAVKFKGEEIRFNPKLVSTLIEPGIFFIAGVILTLCFQMIGVIFIVCGVIYSLGYVAAYYKTDHFMMDNIDKMICNEEMHRLFIKDQEPERGFEFHGKRPKDPAASKRLFEDYIDAEVIEDDESPEVK